MKKLFLYLITCILFLGDMSLTGCTDLSSGRKEGNSSSAIVTGTVSTPALTATATPEYSAVPKHKSIKTMKVCDLPECLREYSTVRAELTASEKRAAELGKIPGGKTVSYVEVKRNRIPEDEIEKYKIGKVNFLSSPEQCDKVLGTPKVKTERERRYAYQSDYEVCLSFSRKGKMKEMGIYKDSREQAKKTYQVGDFTMVACRVIKYDNINYTREESVQFPDDTIAVGKHAFRFDNGWHYEVKNGQSVKPEWKTMTLSIPKDVYLEPESMSLLGPAEITFESGRTEIEPKAFMYLDNGFSISIQLPETVKVLQREAFYSTGSSVQLVLNEGLKEIKYRALMSAVCDLPSTIEILGEEALVGWNPVHDYVLPESLQEIGDCCIEIDEDIDKPIYIPQSVKKIGINSITFESVTKNTCGVKVDPGNKKFKNDDKGWLYSKDGKTLYSAFGTEKKVILPEGVEKIKCCIQLMDEDEDWQEIVFPKSITKKEYNAFLEEAGIIIII